MDTLDQSDDLARRSAELRARSVRVRAAADKTMEKSRRLIAAAAEAREAVTCAHGWERTGRDGLFARHGRLLAS